MTQIWMFLKVVNLLDSIKKAINSIIIRRQIRIIMSIYKESSSMAFCLALELLMEQTQMKIRNLLVRIRRNIKALEIVWTYWRNFGTIFTIGWRIVTNQKTPLLRKKYIIKKYTKHNLLKTQLPTKYMNLQGITIVEILILCSQTNKW